MRIRLLQVPAPRLFPAKIDKCTTHVTCALERANRISDLSHLPLYGIIQVFASLHHQALSACPTTFPIQELQLLEQSAPYYMYGSHLFANKLCLLLN